MTNPLLSISKLCKAYSVPVLNGVDIEVRAAEVHALMGANGAGKTTLCNIICGLTCADAGQMLYRGHNYHPASITDSESVNIRMVMQELNLIDNLSVAENMFLYDLPNRQGFINFEKINDDARAALIRFGLQDIDPRQKLHTLGIGQQQLIEIARTLTQTCDLLLLDEPTAALTEPQVELLFAEIDKLKESGTGIIYVSHRMDEISRIADRITVLRDGQAVACESVDAINKDEIIRLMTGSVTIDDSAPNRHQAGSIALQIEGLCSSELLRDINLNIYHGEILGIAGLVGSGRTELLRAIYGADKFSKGRIKIGPGFRPISAGSPQLAVNNGIGLITEDRKQQGLLLEQSVKFNISVASLNSFSNKAGWLNAEKENAETEELCGTLALNCISIEQNVKELSGGNQQKVVIARWLLKDCSILLFDEPTRGIDIQTKHMIYALLDELARQDKAIVMVSSETSELLKICDRIAVMSDGRLAEVFRRDEWTPEKIMTAAFSHYSNTNVA